MHHTYPTHYTSCIMKITGIATAAFALTVTRVAARYCTTGLSYCGATLTNIGLYSLCVMSKWLVVY